MDEEFLDLISHTAHVQRCCLDLVKSELDQLAVHGVSPIQALILVKIGHLTTSPTALVVSGWYPGTNPSYNMSKLVEKGFVTRERRSADRRSSALRLTEKGHNLRRLLLALYRRQAEQVPGTAPRPADVAGLVDRLHRFEEWVGCVAHTDAHAPTGAARRTVRQAQQELARVDADVQKAGAAMKQEDYAAAGMALQGVKQRIQDVIAMLPATPTTQSPRRGR